MVKETSVTIIVRLAELKAPFGVCATVRVAVIWSINNCHHHLVYWTHWHSSNTRQASVIIAMDTTELQIKQKCGVQLNIQYNIRNYRTIRFSYHSKNDSSRTMHCIIHHSLWGNHILHDNTPTINKTLIQQDKNVTHSSVHNWQRPTYRAETCCNQSAIDTATYSLEISSPKENMFHYVFAMVLNCHLLYLWSLSDNSAQSRIILPHLLYVFCNTIPTVHVCTLLARMSAD